MSHYTYSILHSNDKVHLRPITLLLAQFIFSPTLTIKGRVTHFTELKVSENIQLRSMQFNTRSSRGSQSTGLTTTTVVDDVNMSDDAPTSTQEGADIVSTQDGEDVSMSDEVTATTPSQVRFESGSSVGDFSRKDLLSTPSSTLRQSSIAKSPDVSPSVQFSTPDQRKSPVPNLQPTDGPPTGNQFPAISALRNSIPPRSNTRYLFGFHPDPDQKLVDQVLNAFSRLLDELEHSDKTLQLVSWKESARDTKVGIRSTNFPRTRAEFIPYCDSFRTSLPQPNKRWYASICVNHDASVTSEDILLNVEETVATESWFFMECSLQTDEPTTEIGWFCYSAREYATKAFRDLLAPLLGITKDRLSLQYKQVKQSGQLYAMVVQVPTTDKTRVNACLSNMYSSQTDRWPWGIRMRYIPYDTVSEVANQIVTNIKRIQGQFSASFKPVQLYLLKFPLDHGIQIMTPSNVLKESTIRQLIMDIVSPISHRGLFHGVVEYNDRQFGHKICLFPYPESQVGTALGYHLVKYPVTILSHFYGAEVIQPLFLRQACENENGIQYNSHTDTITTPQIAELGHCLEQDMKLFSFDISLVQNDNDNSQPDKKRKAAALIQRIDDASVGTVRGHPLSSAAGPKTYGSRPQP